MTETHVLHDDINLCYTMKNVIHVDIHVLHSQHKFVLHGDIITLHSWHKSVFHGNIIMCYIHNINLSYMET